MKQLAAFGHFWWDFVVGDDAILAIGVIIGLAVTALVGWWVLPIVVIATLGLSLWRAVSRRPPETEQPPAH